MNEETRELLFDISGKIGNIVFFICLIIFKVDISIILASFGIGILFSILSYLVMAMTIIHVKK